MKLYQNHGWAVLW